MHTYEENCDLTLWRLWEDMDHYYVVHWCDWFLASLVLRDAYILHFWSIFDEFLELSFQHVMPHFGECWWDHVILDVLLSNTPAIFFGLMFAKWLGIKKYDWLGREGKKSIWDWDVFHW